MAKSKSLAVNTETGELDDLSGALALHGSSDFQVDIMTVPAEGSIVYIPGHPLEYRSDAKAGVFKLGADDIVGKSIDVEIIGANMFVSRLFEKDDSDKPPKQWLQLFFVDKNNAVSHIMFHGKESIKSFKDMMHKSAVFRKPLISQIVTIGMEKRDGEDKDGNDFTYFTSPFTMRPNTDARVAELIAYMNTKPNLFSGDIDEMRRRNGDLS